MTTNKKPNPELAELFVKIGRQVVETNPGMAMAAGSDSLIYGLADGLPGLIAEAECQGSGKGRNSSAAGNGENSG